MPQTRMVSEYLSNQGKGYVLEKANVVRSEPRENLAGSFVKALEKDWKPKKASGPGFIGAGTFERRQVLIGVEKVEDIGAGSGADQHAIFAFQIDDHAEPSEF